MSRAARTFEAAVTQLALGAAAAFVLTAAIGMVVDQTRADPTEYPAASVASPQSSDMHLPAGSVRGALSASVEVR